MLAGVHEKARTELGQALLGTQIVVDEQAAAARAGQLAAQEELLAVQAEHGLHQGLFPAGPDQVGRDALAEDEVQGAQDEGLARAGFAREDVQAGAELQFHVVDEGQVANAQCLEHIRLVTRWVRCRKIALQQGANPSGLVPGRQGQVRAGTEHGSGPEGPHDAL
ncbi:hypothetical protein DSECCO2_512170 [anaerobic digester metagenome]